MWLGSYSQIKGYKCNTMQKVKKIWVCMITTSKAKSLEEKELGWYNWLGISHFSQRNMKHAFKTVKLYWCNKKLTFIEPSHVWKTSDENRQGYLEWVAANQKTFLLQLYKSFIE